MIRSKLIQNMYKLNLQFKHIWILSTENQSLNTKMAEKKEPCERWMRNKNYHFSGVIANNERVIYEPFDSNLIVWIGVDFALKMYFRSIQNWWISQLWRWWRIKIAFNGSHIAVNVKFDFRRVLNLLEKR